MTIDKWIPLMIVIAIAAGGYYWLMQTGQVPEWLGGTTEPSIELPSEPPGKGVIGNAKLDNDPFDLTINFTDEGFEQREARIKKGQRVRFLNSSNQSLWPASGVHPTHTLYPEKEKDDCLGSSFDSCQDLRKNE